MGFVDYDRVVPSNGVFKFKISDNVLDDKDHSIVEITMKDDVCVQLTVIQDGVYVTDHYLGERREYLQDLVDYDPTGQHPEQYYDMID